MEIKTQQMSTVLLFDEMKRMLLFRVRIHVHFEIVPRNIIPTDVKIISGV